MIDPRKLTDGQLQQAAAEEVLHGNAEDAVVFLREAAGRYPGNAEILLGLVDSCFKAGLEEEAVDWVRRLQEMGKGQPGVLDALGERLQSLDRIDLALETFGRLGGFAAAEVRAVGKAREAMLHLRCGRGVEARAAVDDALRLVAHLPEVMSAQARVIRGEDPAGAVEILRKLAIPGGRIPLPFTISSGHTLAAVLDEMGEYDEAFEALGRAKGLLAGHPMAVRFRAERGGWRRWHEEACEFSREEAGAWAAAEPVAGCEGHAFLLGHPRSGTTLLEQMLDAHPEVVSVEEEPVYSTRVDAALVRAHREARVAEGFAEWVRGMPEEALGVYRRRYLDELKKLGGAPNSGVVLMDKNPGLSISVGRLVRTMPHSRVVHMIRDPRDVCLSACFQDVLLTPWSSNWLTLGEAVEQCCFTLDLWLRVRPRMVQPWMEVRYEDLIAAPVAVGRRVTAFLGKEWVLGQGDPAEHARGKFVRSPTHEAVMRPIHGGAIGRWRRYERYFEPYRARLAPYLEAFGYGE
jgi:tetratricopeptide (TPR) repeat protein